MIARPIRRISASLGIANLTNEQFAEMIRKVEATDHFHGA